VTRRALVVDLDGTVVDSHAYTFSAFRAALAPCGIVPEDADIHARFGPPERDILASFVGTAAVEAAYQRLQDFYTRNLHRVRAHPKVPPLLADLRRAGIACALFTGRAAESTARILRAVQLTGAFDSVLAGDDGFAPKPAPDGVLELARRLGCSPQNVWVVGDSPLDVRAARAAGAGARLATWFPLPQRPVLPDVDAVDDPDALRGLWGEAGLKVRES
jgi:HAD superfamily hydrolase (TIGR01509 family)